MPLPVGREMTIGREWTARVWHEMEAVKEKEKDEDREASLPCESDGETPSKRLHPSDAVMDEIGFLNPGGCT